MFTKEERDLIMTALQMSVESLRRSQAKSMMPEMVPVYQKGIEIRLALVEKVRNVEVVKK